MNQPTIAFTGFAQVFLVSANVILISRQQWAAVFIVAFLISFVWSINVRKIVFGNLTDRIIYSLGAAVGGVTGALIASLI